MDGSEARAAAAAAAEQQNTSVGDSLKPKIRVDQPARPIHVGSTQKKSGDFRDFQLTLLARQPPFSSAPTEGTSRSACIYAVPSKGPIKTTRDNVLRISPFLSLNRACC